MYEITVSTIKIKTISKQYENKVTTIPIATAPAAATGVADADPSSPLTLVSAASAGPTASSAEPPATATRNNDAIKIESNIPRSVLPNL